jgi:hypothetical protein
MQGPLNSIEHRIRNSPNLNPHLYNINFHVFFDYTAGKAAFYLHVWPSDARMRHRQKAYGS